MDIPLWCMYTVSMSKREAQAVARLRAAQSTYNALVAESERRAYVRGSAFDRAKDAAFNELNNALWPFRTGTYQTPNDISFNLKGN